MLSKDALATLSQLKDTIQANKDIALGTVRGTTGRFGFVNLDDGREAFIDHEQMVRVFPEDRIEVSVSSNEKGQLNAELEKFISSPTKELYGQYCIRGKGHFIAAELQQSQRWIFIPPKHRANSRDGDYITAQIIRHPFQDGKPQAKVLTVLGNPETAGIERLCTLTKFGIDEQWPENILKQVDQICQQPTVTNYGEDLKNLPFVTIDSASTRDIDDALAIESHDKGWILHVAIADPSSEIDCDSPLGNLARSRVSTLYLPGKPVPMLPETLSTDRFALIANNCRNALVCRLNITHKGEIEDYHFHFATVRSQAKLSYQQVTALLTDEPFTITGNLSDASCHKDQLKALQACSEALKHYRHDHCLVSCNRADYYLCLNHQGKLEKIEKVGRTLAHSIVEEAMLATNMCAGDFLAKHDVGIFSCHGGIREERRKDIEMLFKEQLPEDIAIDTTKLESFCHMIRTIQSNEKYQPLLTIYQRHLQASELSIRPKPHFGLGIEHYATVTSPIRRYQDFYNHTAIRSILNKKVVNGQQSDREQQHNSPNPSIETKQLEKINAQLNYNRQTVRYLENWLICDYMTDKIGRTFTATVSILSRRGVGIRLVDTGIEGFVYAKKTVTRGTPESADKLSFNQQRMQLTWNEDCYLLDQVVKVTLVKIDQDKKSLHFAWSSRSDN